MPLSEDATIYIRVWLAQRCIACGAEFQYLRRFKVLRRDTMVHDTPQTLEKQYARHAGQSPEICPCPQCGWIQPDMIAGAKSDYHSTGTLIVVLILLVNAIATALVLMPAAIGCYVAAGAAAAGLLFHLYHAVNNPNRLLVWNLDIAKIRLEEGTLQLIKPGGATAPLVIRSRWGTILAATAMLAAAAFFFASPALVGWSLALGVIPGLILSIISGSRFANAAMALKCNANPTEIVEVNSTVVFDESVPPDFQRK
jgi:hypothetical protein